MLGEKPDRASMLQASWDIWRRITMPDLKPCYGKCELCVWKYNGGCSEWNGWNSRTGEEDKHEQTD